MQLAARQPNNWYILSRKKAFAEELVQPFFSLTYIFSRLPAPFLLLSRLFFFTIFLLTIFCPPYPFPSLTHLLPFTLILYADHTLYRLMDIVDETYATSPLLATPFETSGTDIQKVFTRVPETFPGHIHHGEATHPISENHEFQFETVNSIGSLNALPAIVVNLDRSPDRLVHFQAQVDRAGLNVSRFSAVEGSVLNMDGLVKKNILASEYPMNWKGNLVTRVLLLSMNLSVLAFASVFFFFFLFLCLF